MIHTIQWSNANDKRILHLFYCFKTISYCFIQYFLEHFKSVSVSYKTVAYVRDSAVILSAGYLSEKKSQDSVVANGFFLQSAKTGTVTWEQLVAMFFPLNELQFESLPNCVLFFKLEL